MRGQLNPGIERGPDFDRARTQIYTPFRQIDIDLTTAGSNVIFQVDGDFLYFDPDPSGSMMAGGSSIAGYVTIELNNQYNDQMAAFLAQPGFALNALFSQVKLSWPAQAGKKARLMFSTGGRVAPTNSVSLSGTVNVGNQYVTPYALSYRSITTMAANTPDAIFAAGSNVNGAIVWAASFMSNNGSAATGVGFLAKTSPPANILDGDVIVGVSKIAGASNQINLGELQNPVKIAAGKGLYFLSTIAEAGAFRSCLYTLL